MNGLQTLVNAILSEPDLINSQEIQDFFCLNEPPVYSETNEESRVGVVWFVWVKIEFYCFRRYSRRWRRQ